MTDILSSLLTKVAMSLQATGQQSRIAVSSNIHLSSALRRLRIKGEAISDTNTMVKSAKNADEKESDAIREYHGACLVSLPGQTAL